MTETNYSIQYPHRKQKFTERLQYLISVRMRLDENQRQNLKDAWNKYRAEHRPATPAAIGGSSVTSTVAVQAPALAGLSLIVDC